MRNRVIIRDIQPLLTSANRVESGEDSLIDVPASSFELGGYLVPPPHGFQFPKNFPYCCEYHIDQFTRAQQVYENFPTCCDGHRRLAKTKWFRKLDYIYVPFKLYRW